MLLGLLQAQCHDHCLGEPAPVPDHPLSEESFPNTQLESPLLQLHAVPSGPNLTGPHIKAINYAVYSFQAKYKRQIKCRHSPFFPLIVADTFLEKSVSSWA